VRKLSTKTVAVFMVLTLVMLVSAFACAEPTPGPTPPPAVIELTFNDHNPPPSGPAQAYDYWAQKVEEESNGRLKINIIHGGALFTGDEVFRAVQTGACDGGHYVVDREDGFLLNLVMTLPFMGWPEQHVEDRYQALLDKFPEMQAEWEGVTIIQFMMMPPTHVHTVSKVIKTPTDIKGVKIMCAEATLAEVMNAVGATAVELGIMDMTPSVQTGVVDGAFNHFPVLFIFGTLEFTKCHTIFGDGGINITPMFEIMNTQKLNSLPPDLRDILLNSGHYWLEKFSELDAADIQRSVAYCKEQNHTFTYLTDKDIEEWYNLVKAPIHEQWIAECEAAGLPGQEVYNEALRLAGQ